MCFSSKNLYRVIALAIVVAYSPSLLAVAGDRHTGRSNNSQRAATSAAPKQRAPAKRVQNGGASQSVLKSTTRGGSSTGNKPLINKGFNKLDPSKNGGFTPIPAKNGNTGINGTGLPQPGYNSGITFPNRFDKLDPSKNGGFTPIPAPNGNTGRNGTGLPQPGYNSGITFPRPKLPSDGNGNKSRFDKLDPSKNGGFTPIPAPNGNTGINGTGLPQPGYNSGITFPKPKLPSIRPSTLESRRSNMKLSDQKQVKPTELNLKNKTAAPVSSTVKSLNLWDLTQPSGPSPSLSDLTKPAGPSPNLWDLTKPASPTGPILVGNASNAVGSAGKVVKAVPRIKKPTEIKAVPRIKIPKGSTTEISDRISDVERVSKPNPAPAPAPAPSPAPAPAPTPAPAPAPAPAPTPTPAPTPSPATNGGMGGGWGSRVGGVFSQRPFPGYGGGYISGNAAATPVYEAAPPVAYAAPQPVTTAGNADLVLEDVRMVADATLVAGPAYQVRFRNQGMAAAGTFVVAAVTSTDGQFNPEAPRAMLEVPSLAAGEMREVVLRVPRTQFSHLILMVDATSSVSELDETNNNAVIERAAN